MLRGVTPAPLTRCEREERLFWAKVWGCIDGFRITKPIRRTPERELSAKDLEPITETTRRVNEGSAI